MISIWYTPFVMLDMSYRPLHAALDMKFFMDEAVNNRHLHLCRWYARCCQYCKACLRTMTVPCKRQLLRAWLSYCLCMVVTQNWLEGCTVTLMTSSPTISLRSAVSCMSTAAGHVQACVTH